MRVWRVIVLLPLPACRLLIEISAHSFTLSFPSHSDIAFSSDTTNDMSGSYEEYGDDYEGGYDSSEVADEEGIEAGDMEGIGDAHEVDVEEEDEEVDMHAAQFQQLSQAMRQVHSQDRQRRAKQQRTPIPAPAEVVVRDEETTRTHSKDKLRTIHRNNLILLGRLEEINRKGGALEADIKQRKVKVAASSGINRRKQLHETTQQNQALLRRLEGAKSTIPKAKPPSRARRGPPKQKLKQPEWQS
eukprot:m.129162 g.129162  ORF g.129162 m.129162 type:complete len:244 (-) comp13887_c1_seq2:8322-9053(-)